MLTRFLSISIVLSAMLAPLAGPHAQTMTQERQLLRQHFRAIALSEAAQARAGAQLAYPTMFYSGVSYAAPERNSDSLALSGQIARLGAAMRSPASMIPVVCDAIRMGASWSRVVSVPSGTWS